MGLPPLAELRHPDERVDPRQRAHDRRSVARLQKALYTQPEWAAAFFRDPTGAKGTLVPVRVRECEVNDLFGPIVYIDLVGKDEQQARATLLAGVKLGRAKPDVPPRFPNEKAPAFPGARRSGSSQDDPPEHIHADAGGTSEPPRKGKLPTVLAVILGLSLATVGLRSVLQDDKKPEAPAPHRKVARTDGPAGGKTYSFWTRARSSPEGMTPQVYRFDYESLEACRAAMASYATPRYIIPELECGKEPNAEDLRRRCEKGEPIPCLVYQRLD